ncbi:hypothetical protein B484DRAFT_433518, partial [Ochromonadaceae sp. CCMP2298]
MDLQIGLCFSYAAAVDGAGGESQVRYGRLVSETADGSWVSAPLLPLESIDPALIPVDPDDNALSLVDGAIRIIPAMVLDARRSSRTIVEPATLPSFRPLLVANKHWFRSTHLIYREGMHGVFRVAHVFLEEHPA